MKKYILDVRLDIKDNMQINGLGIDSIWSGSGTLTGSFYNPRYDSKITLKKGTFKLTDTSFKLKRGEMIFDSDGQNIDVSAEKKIDSIIVGARLTQNKSRTSNVKFYSTPYMSQRDILSYILFDKNATDISMSESMALLSIMGKLTNATAGFSLIDKIKDVFGIDSVTIKKNTSVKNGEYNALSIGKKIGKLNISIDQGSAKDTTNVAIDAKIAKNAKVSVDMSGKNSVGAGILWSKRY